MRLDDMTHTKILPRVKIRSLADADLDAANRVTMAAYERTTTMRPHLALHLRVEPQGLFGADDEGHIVGTAGAVVYGDVAYLGSMAVLPERQKQGLGRELLEHALDWAAGQGARTVLLDATAKGAPLYESVGFLPDSIACHCERVAADVAATTPRAPSGVQVALAAPDDLEAVIEFDAPRFGAHREKLFAALWPEHARSCWLARDEGGELLGFLMARGAHLGPWVARDATIADALLATALAASREPTLQLYLPRSNDAGRRLVERHGFRVLRQLRHMRRGRSGSIGRPDCLFGQSSFGHG